MKRLLPALLLIGLTSGCASLYEDQERQATAQQEDMNILQDKINKLQGRIEGLELEQQRVQQQLDAMPKSNAAQIDSLQSRVNDLDGRIRAVDAAREKDKQAIIDTLSTKITQVVSASSGSSNSGKTTSKQNTKAATGKGYDHIVEAGQTISEIAAAYKVRVSDIITANDLKIPNHLKVGQKLFIPAP